MYFNTKKVTEYPSLSFQNCPVEFISSHKHIGITFSENLKWTSYIDIIIAKAHKKLNLMKKLKYKLNRKSLSLMYISFVRRHLEYASEV